MLKQGLMAIVLLAITAGAALAQNPKLRTARADNLGRTKLPAANTHTTSDMDQQLSLGQLTPTPSMWFYQQELEQYLDPKMAVRRKAEFDASQRKMRIATAKWYGYSSSRPLASHTPFTYYYSPFWSGNTRLPFVWSAYQEPTTVVIESRDDYRGN
jgi:hypothetical protein